MKKNSAMFGLCLFRVWVTPPRQYRPGSTLDRLSVPVCLCISMSRKLLHTVHSTVYFDLVALSLSLSLDMCTDREAGRGTEGETDKTDSTDRQRQRDRYRQRDRQERQAVGQTGRRADEQTSLTLQLVARHLGLALSGIVIMPVACGLRQV